MSVKNRAATKVIDQSLQSILAAVGELQDMGAKVSEWASDELKNIDEQIWSVVWACDEEEQS